jgi:transcriptional regulator with XRE-family HTH domain
MEIGGVCLDHILTIRDQLATYLLSQELSINRFSVITGINSGTLSRIINGHQAISMRHLERISSNMGLADDYFFSLYVDECFFQSVPNWRRICPFIRRCAALERLDCIERIVQILLDNLAYAPLLFDTAEELFQEGKRQAAALLYKHVSVSEKYQHSERLALCQYRLFLIEVGDDQSTNLKAATLFECYVDRLSEADQLDALKHLAHVYGSLHRWDKVDEMAKELYRIASIQYDLQSKSNREYNKDIRSEKPLYFYILYSHLIRSTVCEEDGDYKQAIEFVTLYADGSWIQEESEEAQQIIAQFQNWATANMYLYRMMAGQQEAIPDYVNYISSHEDEIFTTLSKIIQAANQYRWNVDYVLERFSDYIPYRTQLSELGEYNSQIMKDQYARFLAELATYYLHNERNEGIEYILQSLSFSARIGCEDIVIKCVYLFEQYRCKASDEAKVKYKFLISEVVKLNEEKMDNVCGFV